MERPPMHLLQTDSSLTTAETWIMMTSTAMLLPVKPTPVCPPCYTLVTMPWGTARAASTPTAQMAQTAPEEATHPPHSVELPTELAQTATTKDQVVLFPFGRKIESCWTDIANKWTYWFPASEKPLKHLFWVSKPTRRLRNLSPRARCLLLLHTNSYTLPMHSTKRSFTMGPKHLSSWLATILQKQSKCWCQRPNLLHCSIPVSKGWKKCWGDSEDYIPVQSILWTLSKVHRRWSRWTFRVVVVIVVVQICLVMSISQVLTIVQYIYFHGHVLLTFIYIILSFSDTCIMYNQ